MSSNFASNEGYRGSGRGGQGVYPPNKDGSAWETYPRPLINYGGKGEDGSPKVPGGPRRFPKVSEGFQRLPTVSEGFQRFPTVSDGFRSSRRSPEVSEGPRRFPKISKLIVDNS